MLLLRGGLVRQDLDGLARGSCGASRTAVAVAARASVVALAVLAASVEVLFRRCRFSVGE